MNVRAVCEGSFALPMPAADALGLEGREFVTEVEAGFDDFLQLWRDAILAGLS